MQSSIFTMEVPEGLPPALRDAELSKLQTTLGNVADECRAALRETLSDLVGHLADRLAPDAAGGRKRLCASTVENLREFLDTVDARNITSDEDIKRLSDKARAIIGTTTAEKLRDSPSVSGQVRTAMQAVKSEIDAVIERDGGRKIDLDME